MRITKYLKHNQEQNDSTATDTTIEITETAIGIYKNKNITTKLFLSPSLHHTF
jgi:hypothetical protein